MAGPCRGFLQQWTYSGGSCVSFVYGGCRGSANRFETQSQCQAACGYVCLLFNWKVIFQLFEFQWLQKQSRIFFLLPTINTQEIKFRNMQTNSICVWKLWQQCEKMDLCLADQLLSTIHLLWLWRRKYCQQVCFAMTVNVQ